MRYYSLGACFVGLILLAFLIIAAWTRRLKIGETCYRWLRSLAAFLVSVHALIAIYRLATEIAIPRSLEITFVSELIGYLVFWLLVPPIWFFFEYFAVASDAIVGIDSSETNLKRIKDYADLASKIWAAVVTILIFLVTLKK
jgi:hypothetical protein